MIINRTRGIGLALLATVFQTFPAYAVPVDASHSYSSSDIVIEGNLHGDLDGGILTLNSSAPMSNLSVDLQGSHSIPSPTPTTNIIDCYLFNCYVTFYPNLSGTVIPSVWDIGLGGDINLNTNTANLTASFLSSQIASASAVSYPAFGVDVGSTSYLAHQAASAVQSDLNDSGARIDLWAAGYWQSVDIGTVTATKNQVGSDIEVNINLGQTLLSGYLDYGLDLSFSNKSNVTYWLGTTFESDIESYLQSALGDELLSIGNNLDYNEGGYNQQCSATSSSSSRININCIISGNLTYTGRMAVTNVPEPGSNILFTAGLLVLVVVRIKRDRTHFSNKAIY